MKTMSKLEIQDLLFGGQSSSEILLGFLNAEHMSNSPEDRAWRNMQENIFLRNMPVKQALEISSAEIRAAKKK